MQHVGNSEGDKQKGESEEERQRIRGRGGQSMRQQEAQTARKMCVSMYI